MMHAVVDDASVGEQGFEFRRVDSTLEYFEMKRGSSHWTIDDLNCDEPGNLREQIARPVEVRKQLGISRSQFEFGDTRVDLRTHMEYHPPFGGGLLIDKRPFVQGV